jgi:Lectin C-type domain
MIFFRSRIQEFEIIPKTKNCSDLKSLIRTMKVQRILTWLMSAMLALISLLSNSFPAAAEPVPGLCQNDSFITNPANNHQYCFIETLSYWSDANVAAEAKGGNLVTINDQAEQDWLIATFGSYKKTGRGSVWIGLNDEAEEGKFVWVSGEPLTFQAWNPGEPNNSGNEDFVELYFTNGKWNDVPPLSSVMLPAIVEKVIPPAPAIGLCKNDSFITNPANNHQYCWMETSKSWSDAQVAAKAKGGNLVTINDLAERDWLLNTFSGYPGGYSKSNTFAWIGLNDQEEEGKYVWVSGENAAYTSWYPSEPLWVATKDQNITDFVSLSFLKGDLYGKLLVSSDEVYGTISSSEKVNMMPPAIVEKVAAPEPVNPTLDTVINIDARVNNQDKPVLQSLKKGTYRVHLLSTLEGGKFEAWNSINVARTCDSNGKNCDNGWETRYYFKSPYKKVVDSSCSKKFFGSCRYESAGKAAASAPKDVTFTLSKDATVKFYIYDTQNLTNNQGGVSLKIIQE